MMKDLLYTERLGYINSISISKFISEILKVKLFQWFQQEYLEQLPIFLLSLVRLKKVLSVKQLNMGYQLPSGKYLELYDMTIDAITGNEPEIILGSYLLIRTGTVYHAA